MALQGDYPKLSDRYLGRMDDRKFSTHKEVLEAQASQAIDHCLLLSVWRIIPSQSANGHTKLDLKKAKIDVKALGTDVDMMDMVHTLVLHFLSALPHRLSRAWLGRDFFAAQPTLRKMDTMISMVGEREWKFIKESRGGKLDLSWLEINSEMGDPADPLVIPDTFRVRKRTCWAPTVKESDVRKFWLHVSTS